MPSPVSDPDGDHREIQGPDDQQRDHDRDFSQPGNG
jgi:hypothetical protein